MFHFSPFHFRTTQDGHSFKRDGKLALSNSAIITLDWSEDSYHISGVTADFNLVHADAKLQRHERKPQVLRDQTFFVKWKGHRRHFAHHPSISRKKNAK